MSFLKDFSDALGHVKDEAAHTARDLIDIFHTKSDTDPVQGLFTLGAVRNRFGEDSHAGRGITRYLSKTGEDYVIPSDELAKNPFMARAASTNQKRFLEQSLVQGKRLRRKKSQVITGNDFEDSNVGLDDIRDGDVFSLEDRYDYVIGRTDTPSKVWKTVKNIGEDGLFKSAEAFQFTDLGRLLGSNQIQSESHLRFKKSGNTLLPYGDVTHKAQDTFDFHRESPYLGETGYNLTDKNLAKAFRVLGSWKKRPYGVIKLENGKIDSSGVEWE